MQNSVQHCKAQHEMWSAALKAWHNKLGSTAQNSTEPSKAQHRARHISEPSESTATQLSAAHSPDMSPAVTAVLKMLKSAVRMSLWAWAAFRLVAATTKGRVKVMLYCCCTCTSLQADAN